MRTSEAMVKLASERVRRNLAQAIATMRDACDNAERDAARSDDARAVQGVLNSLAWGFANASSSIEGAMASHQDAHDIRAQGGAQEQEDE